jgi:hypothetical protein
MSSSHANVALPRLGDAVGGDASAPMPSEGSGLDLLVCSPSPWALWV